jgi:hypothetical protein
MTFNDLRIDPVEPDALSIQIPHQGHRGVGARSSPKAHGSPASRAALARSSVQMKSKQSMPPSRSNGPSNVHATQQMLGPANTQFWDALSDAPQSTQVAGQNEPQQHVETIEIMSIGGNNKGSKPQSKPAASMSHDNAPSHTPMQPEVYASALSGIKKSPKAGGKASGPEIESAALRFA